MRSLLLSLCLAFAACGTSGGSAKSGTASTTDTSLDTALDASTQDTGSGASGEDTGTAPDTAPDTVADSGSGDDVGIPDTTEDVADTTVEDAAADTAVADTSADATADATAIPEDWVPSRCSPIEAELAAAREEAAVCDRSSQCATQLNTLCPYGGGCHEFYRLGKDRSLLTSIYDRFVSENCGDFVCRCGPPPPTGCIDGSCQVCPEFCPTACAADCACATDGCGCPIPVCAGSITDCGGLLDAMRTAIADMQPCEFDTDCTAELAPACAELGCFYAHHINAQTSHLAALDASYNSLGCSDLSTTACRCGPTPAAVCRANRCVIE